MIKDYLIYFISNFGRNMTSNIKAIIAVKIVIYANCLIDLNSEKSKGERDKITTIVVFKTALNVVN